MLAKEFSSIPDREVPPPEPQDENQLSAANRTCFHRTEELRVERSVTKLTRTKTEANLNRILSETAKITPRPEKESIDSRNVVIAKTIRSALADMRL